MKTHRLSYFDRTGNGGRNNNGNRKDRGGFNFALGNEVNDSAVTVPKTLFHEQRTEISIMQATIRMYMGQQRERLEKAAAGMSVNKHGSAFVASLSKTTKRRQKRLLRTVVESFTADGVIAKVDVYPSEDEEIPTVLADAEPEGVEEFTSDPIMINCISVVQPCLLVDDDVHIEQVSVLDVGSTFSAPLEEDLLDTPLHIDIDDQAEPLRIPQVQGETETENIELFAISLPKETDEEIPIIVGEEEQNNTLEITEEDDAVAEDQEAMKHAPIQPNDASTLGDRAKAKEIDPALDADPIDIIDYESVDDEDAKDVSWLSYPEVPSTAEILPKRENPEAWALPSVEDDKPPVAVNRLRGAWDSKHDYLRAHYLMMREDATKPLRDSVDLMRSSPYTRESDLSQTSIGIYDRVHVSAITYAPQGISIKIVFSLGRVEKKIVWEQSKRLVTGSLVALTTVDDMFATKCILAVVAGRSLKGLNQNPPELDLYFARDSEIQLDPAIEFLMVEDRAGFYEAQRHTLVALQNMISEPFPLSEYLVDLEKEITPPPYLQDKPMVDMSPIYDIPATTGRANVFEPWPENLPTTLDRTQILAVKRMLTKQLAIIQGPPGTGKTHVSVKAIEMMLKSMPLDAPPIIVTCQTNHALDQLLRHISKFESNFIRIGSRSKDLEIVKKRQLFDVRSEMDFPRFLSMSFSRANNALRDCTHKLMNILEPLTEDNGTAIDTDELVKRGILTAAQVASLERANSEWVNLGKRFDPTGAASDETLLGKWLGNSLTRNKKSFEQDDFTFEFEDRDPEFEQVTEQDAENDVSGDADEYEILRGVVTSIHMEHGAKERARLEDHECEKLLLTNNLYRIEGKFRASVFLYLIKKLKDSVISEFRLKAKEYSRVAHIRRTGAFERDVAVLKQQRIIGLTTTGFSKYRAMIVALQPKIVMIEEAAESLEAPVIAACVPSLEQLILVGDHKQLRPHTQVQKHEGDPVNMNISLFERMIINKVKFTVLRRQRRMRPEIRRVLRPLYGDELLDHDSVKDPNRYEPVAGMGGLHSYFYTHAYPEAQDNYRSSVNEWEAHMVSGLFEYLVTNGTAPEKITVITFYNGQRKKILSLLHHNSNIMNYHENVVVNVSTVDSYQGEENDVIILSLVRSNDRGNVGFLSVENRVCVAISRARSGFYIFGNALLLSCENPTWETVVQIMAGKAGEDPPDLPRRRLGFHLPLVCKNHGRKTFIQCPQDWENIHGGCEIKCQEVLSCGHKCRLSCHPFPHDETACLSPCGKTLDCGHPCGEQCGARCICSTCVDCEDVGNSDEEFEVKRNRMTAKSRRNVQLFQEEEDDDNNVDPWIPEGVVDDGHTNGTAGVVAASEVGWKPDDWDGALGSYNGLGEPMWAPTGQLGTGLEEQMDLLSM